MKIQIVNNMQLCVFNTLVEWKIIQPKFAKIFFDALDEVLDDMGCLNTIGRNMLEIRNECKNLAPFFARLILRGLFCNAHCISTLIFVIFLSFLIEADLSSGS